MAKQNARTVGGGVDKLHVGYLTVIVNSTSHRNLYFDWPVAQEAIRKLSKSCHKVVTCKLIKNFIYYISGIGTTCSTVIQREHFFLFVYFNPLNTRVKATFLVRGCF